MAKTRVYERLERVYLVKVEDEKCDVETERDEPKDQTPGHFYNRSASVQKFQNSKLDC